MLPPHRLALLRLVRRAGLVTGALAGVCYSLLYLLVLSEDYALLFGALATFFLAESHRPRV
jgi:inner membrane protein involved in colicin E2 resistance